MARFENLENRGGHVGVDDVEGVKHGERDEVPDGFVRDRLASAQNDLAEIRQRRFDAFDIVVAEVRVSDI